MEDPKKDVNGTINLFTRFLEEVLKNTTILLKINASFQACIQAEHTKNQDFTITRSLTLFSTIYL